MASLYLRSWITVVDPGMIDKIKRIGEDPLQAITLGDEEYKREERKRRERQQQRERQEKAHRTLKEQKTKIMEVLDGAGIGLRIKYTIGYGATEVSCGCAFRFVST